MRKTHQAKKKPEESEEGRMSHGSENPEILEKHTTTNKHTLGGQSALLQRQAREEGEGEAAGEPEFIGEHGSGFINEGVRVEDMDSMQKAAEVREWVQKIPVSNNSREKILAILQDQDIQTLDVLKASARDLKSSSELNTLKMGARNALKIALKGLAAHQQEGGPAWPTQYPSIITLRGLPFVLSGWNGDYQIQDEVRGGRPVWRRSGARKCLVPIIPTEVWWDLGKCRWVLHRDGDSDQAFMRRSAHAGDTPVGKWESGCSVV